MDISVVIPLYNEAESLPALHEWISRVMKAEKRSYELLFINDGSSDDSWAVSAATTARVQRYTADSRRHRVMWSSRWMPTCKTRLTRFPNCTR